MDKFMNASTMVSGAARLTHQDASTNLIHVVNCISKVYGRTAKNFINTRPEDVEAQAISMAGDETLLAMFARGGKVSDGDVVSLIEALKWTGMVMTTGEKPRINLALIEPTEMRGQNPELATKQPAIWNAFLISGYDGTEYKEYGMLPQAKVKSVNILGKSLDSYEVLLEKGGTNER